MCRLVSPSALQCLVCGLLAWSLAKLTPLAGPALDFFVGSFAFHVFDRWVDNWSTKKSLLLLAATAVAWVMLPSLVSPDALPGRLHSLSVAWGGGAPVTALTEVLRLIAQRVDELLLFPLLVLTCALVERGSPRLPWRRLHEFGNLSFGIYLLHFPLQAVFVGAALAMALPSDTFTRPGTLLLFFGLLLVLAALSFRYLEQPVMQRLRHRFAPVTG